MARFRRTTALKTGIFRFSLFQVLILQVHPQYQRTLPIFVSGASYALATRKNGMLPAAIV
jgi:hypothetical protein